jgi:acyl-CoA thioesterase
MDLDTLLNVTAAGDGVFRCDVPDGWQQGRGAYGGLAFGWLVRACGAADPDRPVRSLSVQLTAPVMPGTAEVRVETLRRGTGMSHVAARLVQDGETAAMAVGTLGLPRVPVTYDGMPRPEAPPASSVPAIPWTDAFPPFARHYEFRPCLGHLPWSGAPAAYTGGWVAARDPGARRDAAVVAALLDVWWPGYLVRARRPHIMATVTALLQFTADGGDPAAPALVAVRSEAAADGYTVEDRTLWDAGGRLLGLCRQTMAVLK